MIAGSARFPDLLYHFRHGLAAAGNIRRGPLVGKGFHCACENLQQALWSACGVLKTTEPTACPPLPPNLTADQREGHQPALMNALSAITAMEASSAYTGVRPHERTVRVESQNRHLQDRNRSGVDPARQPRNFAMLIGGLPALSSNMAGRRGRNSSGLLAFSSGTDALAPLPQRRTTDSPRSGGSAHGRWFRISE